MVSNYNEIRFVLDRHAYLDLYSASSLKQQSADRHVTPLGHIILILEYKYETHRFDDREAGLDEFNVEEISEATYR